MDENTRWAILRDAAVFPPPFHTSVICLRDLSVEVMSGQKERRHEWVVDSFNGKTWGRVGTGRYLKWSNCPPVGMARSPLKIPEPDKPIVIYVTLTQYFGLRIGKMSKGSWMIYADALNDWVSIPVGYIGGYLLLP
jgi:hypothetical protein